MTLLSKKKSK